MTVNEAIIVCKILKAHGFGDYSLTVEGGFCGLDNYPNYYSEVEKIINMEGGSMKDRWLCSKNDLIPICEEIEEALRRWKHDRTAVFQSGCGCAESSKRCCGEVPSKESEREV